MATALTLLVLAAVVQIFGTVSESISEARSFVEKVDQLRVTQRQLKQDLEGETAPASPPLSPDLGLGYIEYVEGPLGPVLPLGDPANPQAVNIDRANEMDSTQGDVDDVLSFTTRSRTLPFSGHVAICSYNSGNSTWSLVPAMSQSQLAEVVWFVRGRTLYRRVLLISPQLTFYPPPPNYNSTQSSAFTPTAGFYGWYDVSARYDPVQGQMVANTLADLTRPENRYAHTNGFSPGTSGGPFYFYPPHPHNVLPWLSRLTKNNVTWNTGPYLPSGSPNTLGQASATPWKPNAAPSLATAWLTGMKLPTLCESTYLSPTPTTAPSWDLSQHLPTTGGLSPPPALTLTANGLFDAWRNPYAFSELIDPAGIYTGNHQTYANVARVSEDAILTNVIGFDVKVWDPGAPIVQNGNNNTVLVPGDPGYIQTLETNDNNKISPIGYGAYVDLNYLYPYRKDAGATAANFKPNTFLPSAFSGPGNMSSGLQGSDPGTDGGSNQCVPACSVYDTWCTRFDNYYYGNPNVAPTSSPNVPLGDTSHDGFDNNNVGVVDNAGEKLTWPPYSAPLRGIQVKIRVYEPDSRQVREVTVTQSFFNE
jgi:hypothetical protein